MDEIIKRDQNFVTVVAGITNDVDKDIRMLRVSPSTGRLLVSATGITAGVTSLNGLTGAVVLAAGANISLTPAGNTITIASTGGISGSGTANELTYWVNSTTLGSLTTATYPSLTELSYVKGVTSSIQTQLNSKLSAAVESLNSPSGTITLSASTGAVDVDVNQASSYTWTADHIFTSNIDFTPVDSTSQFFDMNPDSSASVPSRLRFWTSGAIMSSLEANDAQSKDIQYKLPKDEPMTGSILKVLNWSAPVAELEWGSAAGDVVGPASAASNEMTIFDGSTGKLIQGITAVTAGTLVTIGTNSVIYPNENVISIGTVSSTYTGSFSGSTNSANGLDIYNSNVGTSKITQVLLRSGSTTGADTYGKILAYPTNYTNAALAARFVIEAGTSQQFVFQTNSNFEWRQNSTPTAKLTTAGLYIGNGSPLAVLHLKAGTATANTAPLKFTSGTNLTTAEAGVMEYDGTDLFFTPTGTIRKVIPTNINGRSTAQTAAVASVVTQTVGASDATYHVSANVLVTTSTTHNFTVTVAYTDEGNTARTLTLTFSSLAGVFGTAITNVGGAVPYEGVPLHIRAKSGTTITMATVGTFTAVTYNCEASIIKIA